MITAEDKESLEKAKKEFPSKCWECEHARRPWSRSNEEKGWVGCSYPYRNNHHHVDGFMPEKAKISGTGWVDLRAWPFHQSSGALTNFVLLNNRVTECSKFLQKKDR